MSGDHGQGRDRLPRCQGNRGKASAAIAKAQSKGVAAICKACGGADEACDGAQDLTPDTIGFVPLCSVGVPQGAASCARPIATLQDVVACIDCFTELEVDCATLAAVPGFGTYPPECRPVEP